MEKLKICIVGFGWFGKMHYSVYKDMNNVEVIGVCDANENSFSSKQKSLQDEFHKDVSQNKDSLSGNINIYTDVEKMLKELKPDLLDIVVPEDVHIDVALKGIEYGCDLIIEKPMTVNYKDAQKIEMEANKKGVHVYVGQVLRFDDRYRALEEMLQNTTKDEIRHITMERNFQSKSHLVYGRVHPAYSCLAHDIDLTLWLSKNKVKSVSAFANSFLNRTYPDNIVAVLELENGSLATLQNSWHIAQKCPYGFEFSSKIITNKDVFVIKNEPVIHNWSNDTVDYPELFFWPKINGKVKGALRNELEHYVQCALEKIESPILHLSEVVEIIKVANAIEDSINKKEKIIL